MLEGRAACSRRGALLVGLACGAVALAAACSLTLPLDELDRDPPWPSDSGVDADAGDAPKDGADGAADGADAATDAPTDGDADASTCTNKAFDPDETDVDCGGVCPKCGAGKKCKVAADCQSAACDSGKCLPCPIGMLRVPIGTAFYCIDGNEVTTAAYGEFASKTAVKDVTTLPTTCKWKSSFVASGAGAPDEPVTGVDWCDAWAFCETAGKRLCGAIGSGGSKPASPFDKYDDTNVDQWRHACSYASFTPTWPYGGSAQPARCNTSDRLGADAAVTSVVPVRSLATCNGAANGPELAALYDMSGNVAEWTDSCQTTLGADDPCRVRGGSFRDKASSAACGVAMSRSRKDRQDWVGFRCCRF